MATVLCTAGCSILFEPSGPALDAGKLPSTAGCGTLSALASDFDSDLPELWDLLAPAKLVDGEVQINLQEMVGGDIAGISHTGYHDLPAAMDVQIGSLADLGVDGVEAKLRFGLGSDDHYAYISLFNSGIVRVYENDNGDGKTLETVDRLNVPEGDYFLRVAASNGTIAFEHSADGANWALVHEMAGDGQPVNTRVVVSIEEPPSEQRVASFKSVGRLCED